MDAVLSFLDQPLSSLAQHRGFLWGLGIFSALMFLATLMAVPWLILRIPDDYFSLGRRHSMHWKEEHPLVRLLLLSLKNLLGVVLIALGAAMLLLPGQGLLTILVGIILVDFPGKFQFERWLIQREPILNSVNWLRRRRGRPPLSL